MMETIFGKAWGGMMTDFNFLHTVYSFHIRKDFKQIWQNSWSWIHWCLLYTFFVLFFSYFKNFSKTNKPKYCFYLPQVFHALDMQTWEMLSPTEMCCQSLSRTERSRNRIISSNFPEDEEPQILILNHQGQCFLILYFPLISQQLKEEVSEGKYKTKNVGDLSYVWYNFPFLFSDSGK